VAQKAMTPAVITGLCLYLTLWGAMAAAFIYFTVAAGYPVWLGAVAVFLFFTFANGSLAYLARAKQLRAQGQQPPPFFRFLFFPKPFSLRDKVAVPRVFRVLLGVVVLLPGGVFLAAAGGLLLVKLDYSTVPHPAAAAVALLFLALIGLGSMYVGYRMVVEGRRAVVRPSAEPMKLAALSLLLLALPAQAAELKVLSGNGARAAVIAPEAAPVLRAAGVEPFVE
jgi:hypothetical protein